MQKSVIATALGAVTSAGLTLACCLPVGFLGAAGLMSLSLFFNKARVWLYVLSALLLVVGFVQVSRARQCSVGSRRASLAVLVFAMMLVLVVALAPQAVAMFFADYLPGGDR